MTPEELEAADIALDLAIGEWIGNEALGRNPVFDVEAFMASCDQAEREELDAENERRLFGR